VQSIWSARNTKTLKLGSQQQNTVCKDPSQGKFSVGHADEQLDNSPELNHEEVPAIDIQKGRAEVDEENGKKGEEGQHSELLVSAAFIIVFEYSKYMDTAYVLCRSQTP
jgi:hypothetical protein